MYTHVHSVTHKQPYSIHTHIHTFMYIQTHTYTNTDRNSFRGRDIRVKLGQMDILHRRWHSESSVNKNR